MPLQSLSHGHGRLVLVLLQRLRFSTFLVQLLHHILCCLAFGRTTDSDDKVRIYIPSPLEEAWFENVETWAERPCGPSTLGDEPYAAGPQYFSRFVIGSEGAERERTRLREQQENIGKNGCSPPTTQELLQPARNKDANATGTATSIALCPPSAVHRGRCGDRCGTNGNGDEDHGPAPTQSFSTSSTVPSTRTTSSDREAVEPIEPLAFLLRHAAWPCVGPSLLRWYAEMVRRSSLERKQLVRWGRLDVGRGRGGETSDGDFDDETTVGNMLRYVLIAYNVGGGATQLEHFDIASAVSDFLLQNAFLYEQGRGYGSPGLDFEIDRLVKNLRSLTANWTQRASMEVPPLGILLARAVYAAATDRSYLHLGGATSATTRTSAQENDKKFFLFDFGSGYYGSGDGGSSTKWLLHAYARQGIFFEAVFAYEKQKLDAERYRREVEDHLEEEERMRTTSAPWSSVDGVEDVAVQVQAGGEEENSHVGDDEGEEEPVTLSLRGRSRSTFVIEKVEKNEQQEGVRPPPSLQFRLRRRSPSTKRRREVRTFPETISVFGPIVQLRKDGGLADTIPASINNRTSSTFYLLPPEFLEFCTSVSGVPRNGSTKSGTGSSSTCVLKLDVDDPDLEHAVLDEILALLEKTEGGGEERQNLVQHPAPNLEGAGEDASRTSFNKRPRLQQLNLFELFWEPHTHVLFNFNMRLPSLGSRIGNFRLPYDYLRRLRERGVRAHGWV